MRSKRRSWVIGSIVLVLIASTLFSSLSSRLTPCKPTARLVLKSTLAFDPLWTICTGLSSTIRGILIDRDNLILGDYTRNALVAFDLKSGEVRWQTPIQVPLALIFDKVRQRLYTYTIYGNSREIYAVNVNTGDVVWRNDDYNGTHNLHIPFLLADGQIISTDYSSLPRQINVDTGAFGETTSSASLRIFPDGHAWIVENGTLTAINALSGEIVWQAAEANISDDRCLNDVQVNRTTVLAKLCNQLVVYDFVSRAVRWVRHIDTLVGDASLTDDTVYVLDATATLQMLRLSDGSQTGAIQFEAPASGHDWANGGSDQIGGSQIIASGNHIAIYFADTSVLSVYRLP